MGWGNQSRATIWEVKATIQGGLEQDSSIGGGKWLESEYF